MIQIERGKFIKISSTDGYLTSWKDTDDILDFNSFKIGCLPLDADVDVYYEISEERNQELIDMLMKAIDEQQKADKLTTL